MAEKKDLSCAEVSRDLNEPMLGTAPQVGLWIMLEVRDTWEAKNLVANDLPSTAKEWLAYVQTKGAEMGFMPRVQFIRHRRSRTDPLAVMTCRNGELRKQLFNDYDELSNINPFDSSIPHCQEQLYFVCTHAKRDVCCSKFGIPTWQKLDALSNGRAWQTSHLGGHRYATNVLVLPSGHSYGRVMADQTEVFFNTVEQGEIVFEHLRGNSAWPPEAQVCECAIQADDGQFESVTDEAVRYRTSSGSRSLPLPSQKSMHVLASCRDEQLKQVMVFAPSD